MGFQASRLGQQAWPDKPLLIPSERLDAWLRLLSVREGRAILFLTSTPGSSLARPSCMADSMVRVLCSIFLYLIRDFSVPVDGSACVDCVSPSRERHLVGP
jgi:hypothetical protein